MINDTAFALPKLDDLNRCFWTCGVDGTLRIFRCGNCGFWLHPPNLLCSQCGSDKLELMPVSGRGNVATFTINHQPWNPGMQVPYTIAIVELEEQAGLRLTSNVINVTEPIYIGQPVKVVFQQRDDVWLPLFEPV